MVPEIVVNWTSLFSSRGLATVKNLGFSSGDVIRESCIVWIPSLAYGRREASSLARLFISGRRSRPCSNGQSFNFLPTSFPCHAVGCKSLDVM
jgi:hypothetical protein